MMKITQCKATSLLEINVFKARPRTETKETSDINIILNPLAIAVPHPWDSSKGALWIPSGIHLCSLAQTLQAFEPVIQSPNQG